MVVGPAPRGVGPDVARMQDVVHRLASEDFAGRRVGSTGGWAAVFWLADQLRAAGADVELDEFTVDGVVREVYSTPQLVFTTNDGAARSLVFRREFCEHLASADLPQPRTGRLATLGDNDLANAWVMIDGFPTTQAAGASLAGAAGVLVARGTDAAGWMPKMIAGPAATGVAVLAVRTDLHEQMRAVVGRATVTASVPLRTVDVTGANVVATFRPLRPARLNVLLTAHFDGVGDDPGLRFPAACDNASGVAAVMEAARVLHGTLPPHVGLTAAFLDAEEAGAYGAAHLAPSIPDGTVVINLDGAAQLADAAHVEAGGPARTLLTALDQAGRQVGVPLQAHAMPSDNRRFAAAGLAAVGIGMGMPGYQTPAETPDRVSPETLDLAARLIIATVANLAAP
ncbi:MAG: M28 family peptidase [Micromonosporaceae bacterium]|nr:M28 family peptidase [Micromonosporaceae bacterium]